MKGKNCWKLRNHRWTGIQVSLAILSETAFQPPNPIPKPSISFSYQCAFKQGNRETFHMRKRVPNCEGHSLPLAKLPVAWRAKIAGNWGNHRWTGIQVSLAILSETAFQPPNPIPKPSISFSYQCAFKQGNRETFHMRKRVPNCEGNAQFCHRAYLQALVDLPPKSWSPKQPKLNWQTCEFSCSL